MSWLENSFAPRMNKVNGNVWVVSIKDSVMQILPFIFVGSVFTLLAILTEFISWWPNFWTPYGWTMGLVALFIAFLIPFNLMEKKRLRRQRLIAGLSSVALYLIIITPQVVADAAPGFGSPALGPGGMFAAILAGLFTGWIMSLFGRFTLFKDDSAVPDFVRGWFDAMLPIATVVIAGWVAVDLLHLDIYRGITAAFTPLQSVIETPWGYLVATFLPCFLYSMGISVWVLVPVITPIALGAINANIDGAQNIYTNETNYIYLALGGAGITLPLLVMFLRSRSTRLKALGRASLVPGIFNINEPIVFGAVAWNPIMMVPMWLQGLIPPAIVYLFTKGIPLAPLPDRLFQLWYTPFPLNTWLGTGSVRAVLLAVVVLVVAALIWYPFFRAYEKQLVEAERAETATTGTSTAVTTTTTDADAEPATPRGPGASGKPEGAQA